MLKVNLYLTKLAVKTMNMNTMITEIELLNQRIKSFHLEKNLTV
jgi:hypothetical protein